MGGDDDGHRDGRRAGVALAASALLVGLLLAHGPTILSGFRVVQTDPGDTRLINYLLEHNWRWYHGEPTHARFWDPPFFYPAHHTASYSDTFLGVAPLYAAFRAAGFEADTSFQLWCISLSVLNYAAMLRLLRARARLSWAGAVAGAFLFAFTAARVNRLPTPQHFTQFFSVIVIDAIWGIFDGVPRPVWRRGLLWAVAAAALVAQLTSSFYLGWFLVLSLGFAAAVAVLWPPTRGPLFDVLWRDLIWWVGVGAVTAVVFRAWVAEHRAAEIGPRFLQFVGLFLPQPVTWLYQGPRSWLGAWTARVVTFPAPTTEVEQRLGLGLVTTIVGLAGLAVGWRRPPFRLAALTAALLFVSLTVLPVGLVASAEFALVVVPLTLAWAVRRDRPGVLALLLLLTLVPLWGGPVVRPDHIRIGILALTLAAWAGFGPADREPWEGPAREGPLARPVFAGLAVALLVSLVPAPVVLELGLAFSLLAVVAARCLRRGGAGGGLAFAVWAGFVLATTYGDHPILFFSAAATPLVAFAARNVPGGAVGRYRPGPGSLALAFAGALLIARVFDEAGSAWRTFYMEVPGASAMLFVTRVGLMILIPAALGAGLFVDAVVLPRWKSWGVAGRGLILGVVALCVLEQGVTNPSFDKADNRRIIAAIAADVGRGSGAFYFSPGPGARPTFYSNIDAMWAGLSLGRPTLNGYSGGTPVGWRLLENAKVDEPIDVARVREILRAWRKGDGRRAGRVTWVVAGVPWDLDDALNPEADLWFWPWLWPG